MDDYARIVAPEYPGTMEYTPEQIAEYMGRDAGGQNSSMAEQLSEFGAWREQVMGVETRNGGNVRLLLECIATCERLKVAGQKTLEKLVAEQYAPQKHQRRWERHGIVRPFVWHDPVERQRKSNVMKVEFELLPHWLRGGRSRGGEPQRQQRETKTPERLGGYYEPEAEDVI